MDARSHVEGGKRSRNRGRQALFYYSSAVAQCGDEMSGRRGPRRPRLRIPSDAGCSSSVSSLSPSPCLTYQLIPVIPTDFSFSILSLTHETPLRFASLALSIQFLLSCTHGLVWLARISRNFRLQQSGVVLNRLERSAMISHCPTLRRTHTAQHSRRATPPPHIVSPTFWTLSAPPRCRANNQVKRGKYILPPHGDSLQCHRYQIFT